MFLGPVEQSKPWDTNGIDGCFRFLKKLWALYWDKDGNLALTDEEPSADSLNERSEFNFLFRDTASFQTDLPGSGTQNCFP
ncbi:MAG: hypothetical protein II030_01150, partial [Treponema sp.]|nr:hypothetical protein [Treponema sp.]